MLGSVVTGIGREAFYATECNGRGASFRASVANRGALKRAVLALIPNGCTAPFTVSADTAALTTRLAG